MTTRTIGGRNAFGVRTGWLLAAIGGAMLALAAEASGDPPRLGTGINDYYFYGHQPRMPMGNPDPLLAFDPLVDVATCRGCHGMYVGDPAPWEQYLPHARWSYSMKSQSYRDPLVLAQMAVAEADAGSSGDACLRCHAPLGWIQKRGFPTDGSGMQVGDMDGVTCSVCHRMVDPQEQPYPSPAHGTPPHDGTLLGDQDRLILEHLGSHRPPDFANGGATAANSYVIDNQDRRRGPMDLGDFFYHEYMESVFHESSRQCAACHDGSNPIYTRLPDGAYAMNALDTAHPTGNKYDMFPMDRLYSEWAASEFAVAPVELLIDDPNGGPQRVGRYSFDGVSRVLAFDELQQRWVATAQVPVNEGTTYGECHECHMPDTSGSPVIPSLGMPWEDDVPQHNFAGVNSWVLQSVASLFSSAESGLEDPQRVGASVQRNIAMQRKALDLEVTRAGAGIRVRLINQAGHKVPAGFAQGRRMWINVRFLDSAGVLVAERGAYNAAEASLHEADTKVYQSLQGMDVTVAGAAGLAAGPSFHVGLNNVVLLDNRIPPRGFTNAGFAAVQAAPVGYAYADGQYWDDTMFTVPDGAVRAEVRVFHQTTSRDYIEFLRDNATGPSPAFRDPNPNAGVPVGALAYNQWVAKGRSEPVEKAFAQLPVSSCPADIATGGSGDPDAGPDGFVTGEDFDLFVMAYFKGMVDARGVLVADICTAGSSDPWSGPEGFLTGEDFDAFVILFFTNCGR